MAGSGRERVLVTGAGGFVMSVFLTELLKRHPEARVTAVDIAAPDAAARARFAEVEDQISFEIADVRDLPAMRAVLAAAKPELVIHGATVTHVPAWERENPHPFIDVNASGTLNVLEAVRSVGTARRVIHVGSVAAYGRGEAGSPEDLQTEAGPFHPEDFYGVGKYAGELIARRFSELHGMSIPVVRFSRVFGPMERPTSARKVMHLPFLLAAALVSSRPVRATKRSAEASGDWISAEDVADALIRLSFADKVEGPYNISTGRRIPVPEVMRLIPAEIEWVADGGPAEIDMDPALMFGQHGAFANAAIKADVGWEPRPFAEQVASYLSWAHRNPEVFTID